MRATFVSQALVLIGALSPILWRTQALQLEPSKIALRSISQSYEDTLLRKLFSSIPRREFAVNDLSIELESGDFLVILGASSSGKSTVLRLLQGSEKPVKGQVDIQSTSTPVYLDRKPAFNDKDTVEEAILRRCHHGSATLEAIRYLSRVVDLNTSQIPSQLTQSEIFKYGLIDACIESISFDEPMLHAPILLLDEWMDLETSTVVHKVEETIQRLTKAGAIVVCVTHKPKLLRTPYDSITMCNGKIISRGLTSEGLGFSD
jgi:putative ABC transport system ATP-binding protein